MVDYYERLKIWGRYLFFFSSSLVWQYLWEITIKDNVITIMEVGKYERAYTKCISFPFMFVT